MKNYNSTFKEGIADKASNAAIYKLTFDGTGAVKGGKNLMVDVVTDVATATAVTNATTKTAIDGKYFTDADADADATDYTLANDVVVYKWDKDNSKWTTGRTRDLDKLTGTAISINLYSVNGDDDKIQYGQKLIK